MALSLLTDTVLDITFGVVWWITKKSVNGIYNGISYVFSKNEDEDENENENENENNSENIDDKYDLLDEVRELRVELKELKTELKAIKDK